MSLDWDTEECEQPLPQTDEERGNRQALVWACMGLDLPGITASNLDEWMFRIYYSDHVGVPMLDIPEGWSKADVRRCLKRWVGLRTNVAGKSRAKWLCRMQEIVVRQISMEVEDEEAEETQEEHA